MRTAVLGATGLVGRNMVACLARKSWVSGELLLLCSEKSVGTEILVGSTGVPCQDAATADISGIDIALFSAGASASLQYTPRFQAAGAWVVDNSSAFRMKSKVPLIVPEINGSQVPDLSSRSDHDGGVIANPNCSTIQIAMALAPLHQAFGLRAAHVTTLQSVSGAGQRAVDAFASEQTGDAESDATSQVFPRRLALNVLPEIGTALPDGSFEEEDKVVRELRKILDLPELAVTCTATRVPVLRGHSAAVRVVLAEKTSRETAVAALREWPGLQVADDPHDYLTPQEISERTEVHVGRVRSEAGREDVLLLWVVADNLLKGAAWNAVQIADLLAGIRG